MASYVTRTVHAMSAQLERFNALMVEFLDDLSCTFDEHESLKILHASAEKMFENNSSTPLPACAFQSVAGGIAKGEVERSIPEMLEMVQNMATSLGVAVDVKGEYESSDEATKGAISNYLRPFDGRIDDPEYYVPRSTGSKRVCRRKGFGLSEAD